MLTNLSFLETGKKWPPECEHHRLHKYKTNKDLFNNKHEMVYKEAFKRIERVIGNFEDVVSYPVIINFQKKISLKCADLLLGEPPKIAAGEHESLEQKAVEQIKENSDIINTAYEAAIDQSRYGDGLFIIYNDGNNGVIDVTQPSLWFPVVDENNLKRIINHVLAWTYEEGEGENKKKYLKTQVHYKGYYEERTYQVLKSMSGDTIDKIVDGPTIKETGLSDFAIVQIPNVTTSDTVNGYDDYTDIDSIISELLVRVGQVSRILDKHAAPSVQGPMSALEQDPVTGQYKLKMSSFFAVGSKDDPEVKYITWDGQLEANFKQIELLINQLAVISEMGPALFSFMSDKIGNVPSGSALRRMFMSVLSKVNRMRMKMDPALKKAIKLCSQLGGKNIVDLTDKQISITWQDGLPGDPMEESQILNNRVQKPSMSIRRALQQYDGMSDKEADEEAARIAEEEAQSNPALVPNFDTGGENGGE